MAEPILPQNSDSGITEYTQKSQQFIYKFLEEYSLLHEAYKSLDFYETTTAPATHIDENYINAKRMISLKNQFTPKLINLILDSDFEYGFDSDVDVFIRDQMNNNQLATKSWLNDIFVEYFSNPTILIGLLRAISRLPYLDVYPEGQTIALSALTHNNLEVKECGVRVFENWGNLASLKILEILHVSPAWLQEYIDKVVEYLQKEYNVVFSSENKQK